MHARTRPDEDHGGWPCIPGPSDDVVVTNRQTRCEAGAQRHGAQQGQPGYRTNQEAHVTLSLRTRAAIAVAMLLAVLGWLALGAHAGPLNMRPTGATSEVHNPASPSLDDEADTTEAPETTETTETTEVEHADVAPPADSAVTEDDHGADDDQGEDADDQGEDADEHADEVHDDGEHDDVTDATHDVTDDHGDDASASDGEHADEPSSTDDTTTAD